MAAGAAMPSTDTTVAVTPICGGRIITADVVMLMPIAGPTTTDMPTTDTFPLFTTDLLTIDGPTIRGRRP